MEFGSLAEARAAFLADKPFLARRGIVWERGSEPHSYIPSGFGADMGMATDALPTLATDPNAGIPAMLTTFIDPQVYEILFAELMAAEILGDEVRRGTWIEDTTLFPVEESTGEVSTYGDFSEDAQSNLNVNWPARQSYLFQSIIEYGDREIDRMGAARVNLVAGKQRAMARNLNTFANFAYFLGVQGLQNYGLLNDPNLSASLTPAAKAYGGVQWINSSGQIVASANEILLDIQAIFYELVQQTGGLVKADQTELTLAMAPGTSVALTATNSFNVNVSDLLKKNFPKLTVKTAVQYGLKSASNPQGTAAGNLVQMIAREVQGQRTGYCAFNEKLRTHKIIPAISSFKQKNTSGVWGAILRFPAGVASMVGV